jgi:hypothetical protein
MIERSKITIAFLALCAAITLTTGMIGWALVYGPIPQRDWWDAFYHTLIAFTGDGSYIAAAGEQQLNVWLRVARFTGILTTLSAIATVLIAMLGHRILRWRASRMKNHIAVLGASPFALDIIDDGRNVAVFDTPDTLKRLQVRARAGRVLIVPDQMTDATATRRSIGQPSEIIFGDPDTVTNVERAQEWLKQTDLPGDRMKLRIEDNTVARDLQLLSDDLANATQISRSETIARALVTSMAPTDLAILRGQERVHIGLIGMGSVNLAVAEELALRCHHPALKPLRLTVVDRDIAGAQVRIRSERPDLMNPDFGSDGFAIDFIQMNALECCSAESVGQITGIEARMPLTAIVVAAGENTRNVAIAMRLRQLQVEKLCLKAPIFMRSESQGSVAAARCDDLTSGIVAFGGRHLDAEDLKLERIYAHLARGIHDRWRESPDVEKTDENDWDKMPTAQRRSSYRAALSAIELLYAAGFQPPVGEHLSGLRLEPKFGNAALGDDALICDLTRTEHDRWNAERRLEGYSTAPNGVRDNEKKWHPLILGYEDLLAFDPNQLRKDEVNVRAALFLGIERHEAAPNNDCWRRSVRIGVIGPLVVDADGTRAATRRLIRDICTKDPLFTVKALEILSPNAPGFDRVSARYLAEAWKEMTGRPCRILLMNAASPRTVDDIALRHVGHGLGEQERKELLNDFKAQRHALGFLAADGHQVRCLDMRAIGVSNAELMSDASAYETALTSVQDTLLSRADWMIFDTANETADWTMRALQAWENERGRTALIV